ncbi:prolyl oligopeptidase family protein [gamma proteobacterium NOR5-3]|nr:prolyl oligopeptidase family protein [gamma proteobacterium NOR5-3]
MCFSVSSHAVATDQPKDPDVLDYWISNGDYLDAKISPDGEHLAALVRDQDAVAIIFLSTTDFSFVGGTKTVEGDVIYDYQWANNERIVFAAAEKYGRWEQPIPTGELYAVNLDGKRSERIFGWRANGRVSGRIGGKKPSFASHTILSILPDDPKYILILEHPWELRGNIYRDTRNTFPVVSKLNIYSGKKRRVEKLPHRGANALVDLDGQVRFMRWIDEDSSVNAAFRRTPKSDWEPLTLSLAHERVVLLALDEARGLAYFNTSAGPQRQDTIMAMDVETGATSTVVGPLSADIVDTLTEPGTGIPLGVISLPATPQYDYLDPDHRLVKLHRGLRKAFPDQLVRLISADQAGQQFVVRVDGDRNPGAFYLFDTRTKEARHLFSNRQWLDRTLLSPTETHTVRARDGVSIPVLLTQPHRTSETTPLILLIHGGPHGVRAPWAFDEEVQLLASRGYAILQVNFRGSGGYGLYFEEMGYREWGDGIIHDLVDALHWIKKTYPDRFTKTCAYGGSFGAYAAMQLASMEPELLDCVAAYAGIYDLERMYDEGDVLALRWGEGYLEKAIGTDPEELAAFSPVNHARKITVPVWMVHGSEDQRAPLSQAEAMRDALLAQDKAVTFEVLKGGGHGIASETLRVAFYEDLLAFLATHLSSSPASAWRAADGGSGSGYE